MTMHKCCYPLCEPFIACLHCKQGFTNKGFSQEVRLLACVLVDGTNESLVLNVLCCVRQASAGSEFI